MKKPKALPEELKQAFAYDATNPCGLAWMATGEPVKCSKVKSKGARTEYWSLYWRDESWLAHRVVWFICTGEDIQTKTIDHLNGNGLDNSILNLSPKSHRANCQNKHKQKDNTSGITGVYLNKKKMKSGVIVDYWMASWIDLDGVQRTKCFRISLLGDEQAKQLAITHREAKIKELQDCGMAYTERHGRLG